MGAPGGQTPGRRAWLWAPRLLAHSCLESQLLCSSRPQSRSPGALLGLSRLSGTALPASPQGAPRPRAEGSPDASCSSPCKDAAFSL